MILSIILIFVGFVLLIKGADFLVDGASNIAQKFHIPEIIVGLTIVSIGTSMPELFVSITSALDGYSDMAIGNAIGSNICNLLLVLGVSTMIQSVEIKKETRLVEIPMCSCFTIFFMALCNINTDVSRLDAIILLTLFALFIAYTVFMGIRGDKLSSKDGDMYLVVNDKKRFSTLKDIILIIIGIFALKFGGDLTVNNAVKVAKVFNLNEKVISLTILAIGTSLPELVTSVSAAIKGKSDIAIGNILGSNIFNMLLIIGVSALINPIVFNTSYNLEIMIFMLATILLALFPYIKPKNKMTRSNGFIYVMMYVAYMTYLFI